MPTNRPTKGHAVAQPTTADQPKALKPALNSKPGEPITETAVRELYEETGLTAKPNYLRSPTSSTKPGELKLQTAS